MRLFKGVVCAAAIVCASPALAQVFEIGNAGCCDSGVNQWPGGEAPNFAIDGVGQKYLNFGKEKTGVAVTLGAGGGAATSITLWTANDEEPRDPASFALYGMAGVASGNPGDFLGGLTLIATDAIALPSGRLDGGATALGADSATVNFANTSQYDSYVVVFPTLKNSGSANSMQIAEIQLYDAAGSPLLSPNDMIVGGQLVPEPGAGLLALVCTSAACRRFRRR